MWREPASEVQAIEALEAGATRTLNPPKVKSFRWSSVILQEQAEGDDEVDDEAELNLEKVEEEMAADYSDEVNFQGGSVAQEYKAPRNGKKWRKVLMSFA